MIVPGEALTGMTPRQIERQFAEAGIPVRLVEATGQDAATLRPLRADLLETTFAGRTE
jgi:hypothetical protein